MSIENPEQNILESSLLSDLNTEVKNNNIFTESGSKVVEFKEFDPGKNKGIYIIGENQQNVSQLVLTTENDKKEKQDIEIFAKKIKSSEKAKVEEDTYKICKNSQIPSLNFLCSIKTSEAIYNITKTENYLIPYSRLRIQSLNQYKNMLNKGIYLIERLNELGIQHRDALTRNFGIISNQLTQTIIFDFETAVISNKPLNEKEKNSDKELFLSSMFFQALKQNNNNLELIKKIEEINNQISHTSNIV